MPNSSKAIKPISGFRRYLSLKLRHLLDGYQSIMLKNFPSTYKMLQLFAMGTKEFSKDVFQYLLTSKKLHLDNEVNNMSYHELVKYMETPKDMLKMTPFLLLSSLPFAQYVTLPVAFYFPKTFLSPHYWSIEQRHRFALEAHTKRLYHYRPVFRHLQKQLDKLGSKDFTKTSKVFEQLGSGTHPSVEEVLELKPIFSKEPYGLDFLTGRHIYHLCKIHAVNTLPGKKIRLKDHIYFIQELDDALWREIPKREFTMDELKMACFCRGLNPVTQKREDMIAWLSLWNTVSKSVNDESLSLLLHTPIFLSYNHPSNWRLIH